MNFPGIGTVVNTLAILAGGVVGILWGRHFSERMQESITRAMGLCTVFIAVSGVVETHALAQADKALMAVVSLALGTAFGEWVDLHGRFERLGAWLKRVTHNERDGSFIDAFVTSSLTVCIGAMAIVGAIQDGLQGDPSLLYLKSIMDAIIIVAFVAALGRGALFSALSIFVYQGAITLGARALVPVFTDAAMLNLNLVGNMLIFAIGWNLLHGATKIRVANMLPALVPAVVWALIA